MRIRIALFGLLLVTLVSLPLYLGARQDRVIEERLARVEVAERAVDRAHDNLAAYDTSTYAY